MKNNLNIKRGSLAKTSIRSYMRKIDGPETDNYWQFMSNGNMHFLPIEPEEILLILDIDQNFDISNLVKVFYNNHIGLIKFVDLYSPINPIEMTRKYL